MNPIIYFAFVGFGAGFIGGAWRMSDIRDKPTELQAFTACLAMNLVLTLLALGCVAIEPGISLETAALGLALATGGYLVASALSYGWRHDMGRVRTRADRWAGSIQRRRELKKRGEPMVHPPKAT